MAESTGKSDVRSAQSTLLYEAFRLEPENHFPPMPAHLRW